MCTEHDTCAGVDVDVVVEVAQDADAQTLSGATLPMLACLTPLDAQTDVLFHNVVARSRCGTARACTFDHSVFHRLWFSIGFVSIGFVFFLGLSVFPGSLSLPFLPFLLTQHKPSKNRVMGVMSLTLF